MNVPVSSRAHNSHVIKWQWWPLIVSQFLFVFAVLRDEFNESICEEKVECFSYFLFDQIWVRFVQKCRLHKTEDFVALPWVRLVTIKGSFLARTVRAYFPPTDSSTKRQNPLSEWVIALAIFCSGELMSCMAMSLWSFLTSKIDSPNLSIPA